MDNLILYVFSAGTFREYRLSDSHEGTVYIEIMPGSSEGVITALPVYARNGRWSVNAADGVKAFVNGNEVRDWQLASGDVIKAVTADNKGEAVIYTGEMDASASTFEKYSIIGSKSIGIGYSAENTIVYNSINVLEKHALIDLSSGKADLKAFGTEPNIFVNGSETSRQVLKYGDIVSVMGLKIVYLGEILAVNCPKELKKCDLLKFEDTGAEQSAATSESTIGSAGQIYFQRSPRIIKKPDEGEIDIDAPPAPNTAKEQPLILSMGPSFAMGVGMLVSTMFTLNAYKSNPFMVIPGIVMTGCMLVGTVLWPILSNTYNKLSRRKAEKKRVKRYRQYMQKVYAKLEEKIDRNRKILSGTYPEPTVLMNRAMNKDRRLWERMPANKDFLDIRLGTGVRPSLINVAIPKEHFSMEDDPLLDELNVINKDFITVPNIPITVSLFKNNMLGMIGDRKTILDMVMSMIVQISSLHSYDEVKIACIYGRDEADSWDWVRRLPHVWGPEKAIRFVASTRDEARDVFQYLNEVISDREESGKDTFQNSKMDLPHYMVFIADQSLVGNEPVLRYLTNSSVSLGISTVFVYEKLSMLPKECNSFVQCTETECTVYHRDNPEDGLIAFKPDAVSTADLDAFSYSLSGMKVRELATSLSLPSVLTFLEMYGVGRIEQLEIKRRWRENLSYRSLEAPLGIKAGGSEFYLNIHEKYHGPHGLVAGMTGSGKSEFIQSYILSMAINYHPYDVSFILIDYKGGGMANCFEGLPHVAGTITNLGGSQIRRSLVSLESELKRRQKIFADHGVNHIDKYQQLYKEHKAAEPLPHLVIISDEFAELKAQQPEFMNELVSTARIGRSLGVHLILATQKPSGVVDDQIWSNTRFRICLKVLDRSDSNEMLKRPEAAGIIQPGRCYVQVGNDEIFELIQSGWSGAPYIPSDKIENDTEKQVMLIDGSARAIKTAACKAENVKSSMNQLNAVVGYIADFSAKEGIRPLKLWLEPLKDEVFYNDIAGENGGWDGEGWKAVDHWMKPVVGLYDDPKNQRQSPFEIDMGSDGHLILYGAPGTGKTTFLQTLIYSLATFYPPELVNLYLLDFGGRTMGYFSELPHTGGVLFSDDAEKLDKLFRMLVKELESRKRKFAEFGVGTLLSYMQISGEKEPALVLVIDNYPAFSELYPDFDGTMVSLSREGGNYGIYLIITASNTNSVKYRLSQNIRSMFTLQLNDKYEYAAVVGQTNGLEPEAVRGRGLAKIGIPLEFQTALAGDSANEAERVLQLKGIFQRMNEKWQGRRAKPIPFVPDELTLDMLFENAEAKDLIVQELIPAGYDVNEAELVSIDIGKAFIYPVLGFSQAGKTNFLRMLLRIIKGSFDWKVCVVDGVAGNLRDACITYGADEYISDTEGFDNLVQYLVSEMQSRYKELKAFRQSGSNQSEREYMRKYQRIILLIDDFNSFFKMISETSLDYLENLLGGGSGLEVYFVFTGDPDLLNSLSSQNLYNLVFNGKRGVLLGESLDSQSIFSLNVSYQQRSCQYDTGMGYMIDRNEYRIIKTPLS